MVPGKLEGFQGSLMVSGKLAANQPLTTNLFFPFPAFTKVGDIVSSNSLTEITAKMHNDNELPLSLRASLVYRGLPVINCTK
jgi:hypothetical protein